MSGLALTDRKILFIGGKGGVGKTTTASALALQVAESGRKVLLVSTDPAHSLGDLFDASIGNHERELVPRLWGLEIDPDVQVDEYLSEVKATMREFVRPSMFTEIDRQVELARHSPGATEAALMDRMARIMGDRSETYDQVIFDTAPTGHTLRLLALPEIMAAWMDGLLRSRDRSDALGKAEERLARSGSKKKRVAQHHSDGPEEAIEGKEPAPDELSWFQQADEGPKDRQGQRIRELLLARRRRFSQARRLLLDREVTAFVMVLVPEKLPILETEKALTTLRQHRVPIAALVVNRVLPDEPLGEFLESRRVQEATYLSRIDQLFSDYPRLRVRLLRRDVEGLESLREISAQLR